MTKSSGERVGLIGAVGFFVIWSFISYYIIAVARGPFFSEINLLLPNIPLSNFFENQERKYSTLAPRLRGLKSTNYQCRNRIVNIDKEKLFFSPKEIEKIVNEYDYGHDKDKVVCSNWSDLIADNPTILPFPDPYGFPLLPVASVEAMHQFFPLLFSESKQKFFDRHIIDDITKVSMEYGIFSFPLFWRLEEFQIEVEYKFLSLRMWGFLIIIGILLSCVLAFIPVENPVFTGVLRVIGIGFGLYLIGGNLKTMCYRMSTKSDANVISKVVISEIKNDCYKFLQILEAEKRITPEQKQLMESLIAKR